MQSNLYLSVAAGTPALPSTCRVSYESERARILFAGPVTDHLIFQLCEEIETAWTYYRYTEIELQIDSPGGSLAYLEYYLTRLNEWRKRHHFRLSTLALTQAASAPGVMLCMGDIGYRRACSGAQILLRDARMGEIMMMDKGRRGAVYEVLKATDIRLIKMVVRHINSKVLADITRRDPKKTLV